MSISVYCGSLNGDRQGRRQVTLRGGGIEYNDRIDTASGFQRAELLKRAAVQFDVHADEMLVLDPEIVRAADQVDEQDGVGKKHPPKERFPLVDCAALDGEDYTPTPLIEECLFVGMPGILGGMFKTCKTLVAMDAAISIATGTPFLGVFAVPRPARVLYFSGEGGAAVAQEYGRRIAGAKGGDLSAVDNLKFCFSVPRLERLDDLDAFAAVLDAEKPEVVFVDNLMMCISGDNAGNVYAMGSVLAHAFRLCEERGVTPVFVHHCKRTRQGADRFAPGELSDLTQTGPAEIAGQWFMLNRREDYRPDEPGEHRLWLTIGGRVGHSSLYGLDIHEGRRCDPGGRQWAVDVIEPDAIREAAKDARDEAREESRRAKSSATLEADRAEIVAAMARMAKPETKNRIREHVSCSHDRFARAFASLVKEGDVEPADVTQTNGHTYPGWRLS